MAEIDIESIGTDILAYLGSEAFNNILTSINTEKIDAITLDAFRARKYGWASMEAETPAIYVLGTREETTEHQDHYRKMWYKYAIECYVQEDDAEKIERKLNRYARAVDEGLLTQYPHNGFMMSIDYSPVMRYEDSLYKVCSMQYWIKVVKKTIS